MNDFSSLKRKALPALMVWAVSPAQNTPSGRLQIKRNTDGLLRQFFRIDRQKLTEGVDQ